MPGAQTRDRSFRIRSTIIRFSARSLALSASAWPSATSCSGPTPRGRVPLIGRVSTCPPTSTLQEPLRRRAEHRHVGKVQVGRERRGVTRAQPAIERPRRFGERRFEALRQVRLEDVAGEDVFAHAGDRVEIAVVREGRAKLEAPSHQPSSTGKDGAGAGRGGSTIPPIDSRAVAAGGGVASASRRSRMAAARSAARCVRAHSRDIVSGRPVEMSHARDSSWSHASTQSYTPNTTSGSARSSWRGAGRRSSTRPSRKRGSPRRRPEKAAAPPPVRPRAAPAAPERRRARRPERRAGCRSTGRGSRCASLCCARLRPGRPSERSSGRAACLSPRCRETARYGSAASSSQQRAGSGAGTSSSTRGVLLKSHGSRLKSDLNPLETSNRREPVTRREGHPVRASGCPFRLIR